MNILFVDDVKTSVDVAMDYLRENGNECVYCNFKDFYSRNWNFDIIAIDMMNGGATQDQQGKGGNGVIEKIWNDNFCPIIIYSANPGLANREKHPLIAKVIKGAKSEEKLLAVIKRMAPFVDAKDDIIQYVGNVIKSVSRETVPSFFDDFNCENDIPEDKWAEIFEKITTVFPRIIRRRIAAFFDTGYFAKKLLPYEQYLYPPMGENWLQGDIVKLKSQSSLYLVLTPSCDLEKREDGIKARSILCANCLPFRMEDINPFFHYSSRAKGCQKCSQNCSAREITVCKEKRLNEKRAEEQKQFVSMLNSGLVGDYYVLPALANKLDNMLADLKNLYVIPVAEMENYERVVSIDSPFREKLNEVFIRIAGRIGPPDRDFNAFASGCIPRG